jgi:dTDP-4-amino-4,6-dideoxy-D-galactose acyltransferase
MSEPIEVLRWDTEFFGFPIARLRAEPASDEAVRCADDMCRARGIRCCYALAPSARVDWVWRLMDAGYRWVDIRVALRAALPPRHVSHPISARPARESDLAALADIARRSHLDARYFADARFDRARAADLYAAWVVNAFHGFEDAVWVAEHDAQPAGYITCKLRGEGLGQIGLFAVSENARGRGVGRALLATALDWFARSGCDRVDVVTQGCNVEAQRMYQRNGFVTHTVEIWLHKWFE